MNALTATFYPEGSTPISGIATPQPDGTTKFVPFDHAAFPPGMAPMTGQLKTSSDPNGDRGVMTVDDGGGSGTFKPEIEGTPG